MLQQRTKSKEKPAKTPENNNASTYENCPEMSQSMLREEGHNLNNRTEIGSFLEIGDLINFQDAESKGFSSVFDNSRRLKERKGPDYRRINRYYKSKNQYWRERNRRKKCWELSGQGHNFKQIAEKLGVCEKTVQRDIKKIQPYYLRLSQKYFRELEQQRIDDLNAELEGKNLSQRYNVLSKKMVGYNFLMKQREYNRHMIKIIVDMDDQTDGCPAIHFWPKPPITLRGNPYHFQFHVQRNGNQVYLGDISLS